MEYETSSRNVQWAGLLGGLALGALAMYIADPSQGRRRRALLQDKVSSVSHQTTHALSQKLRDTGNRLSGLQAGAMHFFSRRDAKPIDDHVLAARVRSRLGRSFSRLHQIAVTAHAGKVTLEGLLDSEEMARLVNLAEAIPGVKSVQHRLQQLPALKSVPKGVPRMLQSRSLWWLAGAMGAYGMRRHAPLALAAVSALGLLARALTHAERGQHRVAIPLSAHEAEQTIDINAAPETVFDVWSHVENFPHFMSNVVEVRDLGQQRSHWVIRGPGGKPVEWDAILTVSERPHRQAWKSDTGSSIEQHGSVQLQAIEGGTRATVRMAWQPAPGADSRLTEVDLGQMLAEDLQRLKQFIERGLPVRDNAAAGKESGPLFH